MQRGAPIGEMAVDIEESLVLGVAMVMPLEPVPQLHRREREVHQQVSEEEPQLGRAAVGGDGLIPSFRLPIIAEQL